MPEAFPRRSRRLRRWLCAAALPVLLAACGGGGPGGGSGGGTTVSPPLSCSVPDMQDWLRAHMNEWYFWYRLSPSPTPAGFPTLGGYFDALLYTGTDPVFPPDRFSTFEPTQSFERFFDAGQSLGYGLFVAGIEVEGQPSLPLRVRYTEPRSDAAAQGVQRGEQILSINGRPASDLIAANDFGVLVPATVGETLRLVLRGSGGDRTVTLSASVYNLTPVSRSVVVSSPAGRRVGYVMVKDMIDQVLPPLDTAFAQFRAQGVTEAVIDLRYNGGGLVSVGARVASYASAARTAGQDYVRLLYNDKRAPFNNQTQRFSNPAAALNLSRVYVLTGPRTCSASEQVINGLRPFVQVVTIGDTTCGKPVGFLPEAPRSVAGQACGDTFSITNFESVNSRNEGRYFDGLNASCPVADDLSRPLGDPAEGLLSAALRHADIGSCPVIAQSERPQQARPPGLRRTEPGDWQGMFTR